MLNSRKEMAEHVYQEMRSRGLCPDSYARSALISMYGATSEVSHKQTATCKLCIGAGATAQHVSSICGLPGEDSWSPCIISASFPIHSMSLNQLLVTGLHVPVRILEACICVVLQQDAQGCSTGLHLQHE